MATVQTPTIKNTRRLNYPRIFFIFFVLALVIGGAIYFKDSFKGKHSAVTMAGLSGYQAIFLTNSQVYFGKIDSIDENFMTLTDVFYLKANADLQSTQSNNSENSQMSLVKLGNELHGPSDVMHISRSQILFYEDLKSDGKVAEAIASYKPELK